MRKRLRNALRRTRRIQARKNGNKGKGNIDNPKADG